MSHRLFLHSALSNVRGWDFLKQVDAVEGESVRPGPDGRFDIDVAIRSNELYPYMPGRTARRAVRFLDDDARAFMMGFGERPAMSADDITHPERTVFYEFAFLPAPTPSTRSRASSASAAACPDATARPGPATTPCPRSSRSRRRSSTATGARRTRATGDGTWGAGRTAPGAPASRGRRRPCSIATLTACGASARAARCSSGPDGRHAVPSGG